MTRGVFLYKWTRQHGFSEGMIGTPMIREAADYVSGHGEEFPKLLDDVYVHVSRVFGRSIRSVERGIRTAIAASALAGCTSSEVIRTAATELRLEMDTSYED